MEKDTAMPDRTVLQEPTTGDCDQVWAWRKWLWKKRREQGTAFQEREGQRRACGERKRRNETPGRGWGQKGRRSRTNPSPPPTLSGRATRGLQGKSEYAGGMVLCLSVLLWRLSTSLSGRRHICRMCEIQSRLPPISSHAGRP